MRSSEVFTLADFRGKTVFVEGMATWCSYCLQQLHNVATVKAQLDAKAYVYIALSVDVNATTAELAAYANREGFDWFFAVISPDLLRELAVVFGQKFTKPLSHFIIRPNGSSTDLAIGVKTPEVINQALVEARLEDAWPDSLKPFF